MPDCCVGFVLLLFAGYFTKPKAIACIQLYIIVYITSCIYAISTKFLVALFRLVCFQLCIVYKKLNTCQKFPVTI